MPIEAYAVMKGIAALGAAAVALRVLHRRKRRTAANQIPVAGPGLQVEEDDLRDFIASQFPDTPVVVVANREPYSHVSDENGVVTVRTTAGGLVTAMEPVLRATGGTWVAHGSGNADRSTVDHRQCVAVPAAAPEYTLRRVFLSALEERQYYCGFSNEALWPLCHNAFTRPAFRREDWLTYQQVNRRFATAALEHSRGVILLQDYHLALAGRYIRDADPRQVIGTFWHIPWPAAEIFSICPWKEEILDGLLALDLIGFHTESYCRNFLDSVERFVGCRVDRKSMSVEYRGRVTRVRAIPISIPFADAHRPLMADTGIRRQLSIGAEVHVSIAVDRVDYTKGILERLSAIDALFQRNPDLSGRYSLVQIAAPSRSSVAAYRDLEQRIEEEVARVNARWERPGWQPVHLIFRSLSRDEVVAYYQMANSALVTPLHDGMNLVAKEYAAACQGDHGVLILSQFAGAAQELTSAITVNPFDIEAVADAIRTAVEMPAQERRRRIAAMHSALRRNTIFDWARILFADLAVIARAREEAKDHDRNSHPTIDRVTTVPLFGIAARG